VIDLRSRPQIQPALGHGNDHLVLCFISMVTYSSGESTTASPFETALRAASGRAGEETGLPSLRASGRGDGTPFPQGERPTTLAGHPEEARCGRAVSKDQGERIRKRIYEMLYLVMHEKVLQVGIAIRRQDPDRQTTMPRTSCETLGNQGS